MVYELCVTLNFELLWGTTLYKYIAIFSHGNSDSPLVQILMEVSLISAHRHSDTCPIRSCWVADRFFTGPDRNCARALYRWPLTLTASGCFRIGIIMLLHPSGCHCRWVFSNCTALFFRLWHYFGWLGTGELAKKVCMKLLSYHVGLPTYLKKWDEQSQSTSFSCALQPSKDQDQCSGSGFCGSGAASAPGEATTLDLFRSAPGCFKTDAVCLVSDHSFEIAEIAAFRFWGTP